MKNKKRFTKLAALALAATMLAGSASVVSAHETKDTTDISLLRGALCPDCNYGQMIMRYSDWTYVGPAYRDCVHYPKGEDRMRKLNRTIYWECPYCSATLTGSTETSYEFEACYGYR